MFQQYQMSWRWALHEQKRWDKGWLGFTWRVKEHSSGSAVMVAGMSLEKSLLVLWGLTMNLFSLSVWAVIGWKPWLLKACWQVGVVRASSEHQNPKELEVWYIHLSDVFRRYQQYGESFVPNTYTVSPIMAKETQSKHADRLNTTKQCMKVFGNVPFSTWEVRNKPTKEARFHIFFLFHTKLT